jgi:starch-binding outer membrane protein, SusD/RagB family
MKNLIYILFALLLVPMASCEIDDLDNPNGSSISGFDNDATKSALQTVVTGMEDLLRQEAGFYYDVTSIIGREYYFFTGSDPRYTGEVLGKESSMLDNAGFYGTRPYFGRYRTIKTANLLIDGATNSSLISAEELRGYLGFAKTIQAYEYHLVANLQYQNGIRIDVSDPDNLGPFVSYDDALIAINRLLDEAVTDLNAAGAAFPFTLSPGMAGFDDPASFITFNRALAARISLYQGNKSEALNKLSDSFMDMGGDLNVGPARFYSTAGGDFANNLFRAPDQADAIIAHPSFVDDATPGDTRLSKVLERPSGTLSLDGLSGDYDVWVYQSLNDFVPFIRNEELILIAAEANIGTDNGAAEAAINVIRNAAGIGDYTGATDDASLLDEVLYQRRYSLLGESHRWVDMRRLGRLGDLPIDRPDDDIWEQFPRPVSEVE